MPEYCRQSIAMESLQEILAEITETTETIEKAGSARFDAFPVFENSGVVTPCTGKAVWAPVLG